jgi:hypothetical protein
LALACGEPMKPGRLIGAELLRNAGALWPANPLLWLAKLPL